MTESFEDAIKALRHIARGNGNVLRIADRIVAAHERETKVEGVCGPITGELRAAMRQWGWVESDGSITFVSSPMPPSIDAEKALAISGSDFDRMCDAIDAVHAQLERENESLKAELNRVLGEQEEHEHTRGESITDELREYATNDSLHYCSDYLAIADRIDAEHERQLGVLYRDMSDAEWVRLPKDADGVPIRLGDELVDTSDKFHCGKAHIIELKEDGWIVFVGSLGIQPHVYRHVKPDTWERIIADAVGCMDYEVERDDDLMDLVARCKALCERTKGDA